MNIDRLNRGNETLFGKSPKEIANAVKTKLNQLEASEQSIVTVGTKLK